MFAARLIVALLTAFAVGHAVAADATRWATWQQLLYSEPATVLHQVEATRTDGWPEADRLRLALLAVRARGELGRADESIDTLDRLREPVQRSGRVDLQAAWQAYYGDALRARDDPEAARPYWDRALRLAEQAGEVELQSLVHTMRAQAALDAHDMGPAAAAVEADRRISEASGDPQLIARNLYWAAGVQQTLENVPRAEAAFREAAQRFGELGNRTWESDCLRQWALVLIGADRAAEALAPAQRAVKLLEALDDEIYLALARSALAQGLAAYGRHAEAQAQSRQALAVAERSGTPNMRASVLLLHARVLLEGGQPAAAARVLDDTARRYRVGWPASSATLRDYHLLRARVLSVQARAPEAAAAWQEVIGLERQRAARVLSDQLQAQGAVLAFERLQRENGLLQERSRQAERALAAELRARWLIIGTVALIVLGAALALFWLGRVNRRIADVAAHDGLTGLLNRRRAQELGTALADSRRRRERPLALLLIDVDHFKRINDTHGHPAGDEALREIAARLRHGLRDSDVIARWGGEEFLVLLPGTGLDGARELAERQRHAVADSAIVLPAARAVLEATVSTGLTLVADHESGLDAALERADRALYRAKRSGRNSVVEVAPPGAGSATPNGGATASSESTSPTAPRDSTLPV